MLTNNDLLVLGFLLERPMHGYEIHQVIKTEEVGIWFEISTAAIYYSLNKLRRLSMIAEAHSRGSSGDKTIYHVTEHGREQFFAGMADLLDSNKPIRTEYDLGIFMLNRLPRDQASGFLDNRISFLEQLQNQLQEKYDEAEGHLLRMAILQHSISIAKLDADWLQNIRQQLDDDETCGTDFDSLMTLQGNLHDFDLPNLMKLIEFGQHGGTLRVASGRMIRSITFQNGQPHCVASQTNGIPEENPDKIMDDVYHLFRWQEGDFTFDQRGCPQVGCRLLTITTDTLILEGARRLDNWDIIQRIVPSSDSLFESCNISEDSETPMLTEDETRILNLVDGFRDVTSIARSSGFTEFETSKTLYGLYAVGYVQPADPDKSKLRRVFREFAELMCRGAIPYRTTPEEASACEQEVNQRCEHLPVRIRNSSIEDQTNMTLSTDELAGIYRTFLQTQHKVLSEHFGRDIANELRQQVLGKISPALLDTIEKYALI
jgi:DNA-binding PadR family transcriptional regulator